MILGAITGVPTPACLSATSNPVEAVTPPQNDAPYWMKQERRWVRARAEWLVLHLLMILR